MFAPLGLFRSLRCPQADSDNACARNPCPYSHKPTRELPVPVSVVPAVEEHVSLESARPPPRKIVHDAGSSRPPNDPSVTSTASTSSRGAPPHAAVPTKRPQVPSPPRRSSISEPPTKVQKGDVVEKRPKPAPPAASSSTSVPVLRINAAYSSVPIRDRQKMLTVLYDHFRTLYENLLPTNPGLATEHALQQELDVYNKSNKVTYRNAIITAVASIKKRPRPDSVSHPSVGTEATLTARAAELASISSFHLTHSHLKPALLAQQQMEAYSYVSSIPEGPGGDRVSELGNEMTCVRCGQQFIVRADPGEEECTYHWGKPFTSKVQGARERVYRCCLQQTTSGEGCQKGPHVFYESDPVALHSRHAFTPTRSARDGAATSIDVIAMDCEMIYTTAGMSVARVSAVDGTGKEVFDQLVRMSEGVDVLDFNTRFSGVTTLVGAVHDLNGVRKALDAFIGPDTILVGHALENDLKTLRMIHSKVVDTAVLYPHRAGPPYRRALRDLSREVLGQTIQTGGGTTGHSSLEDARATLDLVRSWAMDQQRKADGRKT